MSEILSDFEYLKKEVQQGIEGLNSSIPIGIDKLNQHASFRKRIFTLLFSSSGAGKSALTTTMMLNACDWHMKNKPQQDIKFHLFSMERSKKYQIAKWIIRKIFLDHGVTIFISKLLGWNDQKLDKDEHDLFLMYEDYITELLESYINIYEGAKSPIEIRHILKDFYKQNGKYEDISQYKKVYIPDNELLITVPIIDHGNLTKKTAEANTKKAAVDLLVEFMQSFRDLEGASPFWVAQINRTLSGLSGNKDTETEPMLDNIKETSDIADACDLAISLFDPLKYKQSSKTGYNPIDFVDTKTGANYFRSVQILKSSFGEDGVRIPLGFNGFCGDFKAMPKRTDLQEGQYQEFCKSVINKSFFLH